MIQSQHSTLVVHGCDMSSNVVILPEESVLSEEEEHEETSTSYISREALVS